MTEQQELISFYLFENKGIAEAIDRFSQLEGSLTDQLMSAIKDGSWTQINYTLRSVGVYLNVLDVSQINRIFEQGANGYYFMNGDDSVMLEMSVRRKPMFDAICKAYSVNLEGFDWA